MTKNLYLKMEGRNQIKEEIPILFNPDNIPRCPNCNLISSLKLYYLNNIPLINYKCEGGHEGNINLKEYMNIYNKNSLSKEKCGKCGKNQKETKGNFIYCSKCSKFLCNLCQINHSNYNGHDTINIQRYDSLCKIHSNSFCFYCIKCQKNLCIYCQNEHKSHRIINLMEFAYTKDSKKKLKEEIKDIEMKIKNLDNIKINIIELINKIKESSELEIKFMNILLNSYEYEENQHNLNYNIIQNLKNFLKSNKIKTYEKINDEGNKLIYFIQSLLNINTNNCTVKPNSLQKNFKIIRNHKNSVLYLSTLKDGRLASCSEDKTFNIYQKDSFNLQLSIKEHLEWISTFTQLNDERIITCSGDKTMKVIKLLGDNKYLINQTLTGHKDGVMKIIEIKENELISISYDNTMKIWKLKKENKFDCVKTIDFQKSWSECNLLKLNEKEFVISSHKNNFLKFWSLFYLNIATINNIECSWTWRNMCLLEDDILCVGGDNSKGFYLIKISTHQLIKRITGPKIIWSIIKCLDGLILCSVLDENGENSIVKYKYEEKDFKKIIEKGKAHNKYIYSCIELNDGTIASGGDNSLIKLWE